MTISHHSLREHLRLLGTLFGLIAAVWALRLVLYAASLPLHIVRVLSVTVAGAACVLLAAAMIHFRRFGSYANVVAAAFLLVLWAESLISLAILFAILTRTHNVYSLPEFSGHFTPLQNIMAHMTFGLAFGTLFGAAMGSLLLWLLRLSVPLGPPKH